MNATAKKGQSTQGSWLAGWGAVTTLGATADDVFAALLRGDIGLRVFEPPFDQAFRGPHGYVFPGSPTRGPRAASLLVQAVSEALLDAGLTEMQNLDSIPVVIGTGLGEARTLEIAHLEDGPKPNLDLAAKLRKRWGFDRVSVFSNACAASLYAAALACDLLEQESLEHVIVAGVDVLSLSMFGSLDRVQVEPPDRVRPFDAGRRGVLMGEGAAAVVLSKLPHEKPLRLARVELGCDAYHVTAPDPARIEHVMREAHARVGVGADSIDLVVAHGTGTPLNDEAEAVALTRVWERASKPLVTGVKGSTGHTSGASGLHSLIVAGQCLLSGEVPPVVGLDVPDPMASALRLNRSRTRLEDARLAQVDAFGFGGLNAVALLRKVPVMRP
ncbi:hypothetical protein HMPREF1531_00974 [Propionibacterium sp. oral taxon 192 str. F0372]|uniref:beta-ketoacyl synthase N-terminal-like domain-containing protein n=1 Tax=Propionibacterium sp. oral taxon 192 TaxID=671222 RepID=UPI000354327F|nr:beta-ketoacyl synthase N-terminal-like domain-containing protein [Propionibacterium sp. oral taxon 192]EPH05545.1 hypothetical protein HMPREF1531_00974 [Propionibacterium sp. oral taxon 192 str. F0372]